MGKELIISGSRHETKVAILEDDQLVEIYFQRSNEYSLAGSIHKGRVTRVLPGMQSAFVDIGLERDAFLYVSDFFDENEEYDRIGGPGEERGGRPAKSEPAPRHEPAPRLEPAPQPAPEPEAASAAVPASVAEAAPAHGAEAPREEDEGRDRRGRRSRRRRSRGRGFPDSKYASDVPRKAEDTPGDRTEEEPAAEVEEESGELPLVLPGESLAKYRRPESETQGADEAESAGEGGEALGESQPEAATSNGPESVSSYEELYREDLADPKIDSAAGVAAEVGAAEAAATGREVEAEPEAASEMEAEAEASESTEIPEAPDAGAVDIQPMADSAETTEEASPEPFEAEPVIDEDLEPAEAQGGETDSVADAEAGETPAGEEVEPARMPVSLTATLRERGDRYMHRVSRRARRKMRTGGEDRGRHEPARQVPVVEEPEVREAQPPAGRERPPLPSISDLLREGQEILVQIAKEPLGQKGARITSHIALPGRYVVYMPTVEHMGVSRKISSDEERLRLKKILQANRPGTVGGFIVRTAGEGKSEEEIAADMKFLYNLWQDIRVKSESRPAPVLMHHDLDLVHRILRDQMTDTFKTVWVDNEEIYESVLRFVQRFQPTAIGRVKLYTRPAPILEAFNVTAELEKALRPKVWLKSGGYIVINQTEALVAIDVNTGKFVGRSNRLEDTIVKTNTEAVKEIVRQIRLRDLGGIIVVDFIDMDERKNRQKVMQALEEAIRADRAPNKILQFNDFGLVAITRKRVKQSLERTLCAPCPYCEGAGYVKSVQTVISEILLEAHKLAGVIEGKDVLLRVNSEVAKVLKSHENHQLEELEEVLGKTVLVKGDPSLHQEKFDLV
jgi:ribonuclease G